MNHAAGPRDSTCGHDLHPHLEPVVNDASRVTQAEVLKDERAATSVVPFLRRAVAYDARFGVRVERAMTDNGSACVSRLRGQQCARPKLRHRRTRPRRPRTNGRVERMIQLLRERAYVMPYPTSAQRVRGLKPWLACFNRQRPHSALGHRPPSSTPHRLRTTS
uniref:Integrase catalytic domain-containing protein n=1 Tax=Eiseniibacteriota bacterium TaxID=2212470 RepID=A0A832I4R5_UNCEI